MAFTSFSTTTSAFGGTSFSSRIGGKRSLALGFVLSRRLRLLARLLKGEGIGSVGSKRFGRATLRPL